MAISKNPGNDFQKGRQQQQNEAADEKPAIHDLPLPLATSESSNAINHNSKASLRITSADYTAKNAVNRPVERRKTT